MVEERKTEYWDTQERRIDKFGHGLSVRGELRVAPLEDSNSLALSKYEREDGTYSGRKLAGPPFGCEQCV